VVDDRLAVTSGVQSLLARGRRNETASFAEAIRSSGAAPKWVFGAVLGASGVLAFAFVHRVSYDIPTLRATIETAITLMALTGAWLMRARFAQTARVRDLVRLAALLLLALFELCANALPSALGLHGSGQFGATRVLGDLIVAALFAVAALTSTDRIVTDRRGWLPTTAGLCLAVLGLIELLGRALREKLVLAAGHPVFGLNAAASRPLTCVIVTLTGGLLAYAVIRPATRRGFSPSTAGTLLACGLLLLLATRLYYFALPATSPQWVSPREALRLVAVALLLAAAVSQELQMRARTARAAALAERRRVAQDLHDGIAQDLAFIAAHSARMAGELGDEHPLTVAARRALAVSRGTISELSDMSATNADEALEAVALELRNRFRIAITVYAHPDVQIPPEATDHVTRIAREAIANAARHGQADNVVVSLRPATHGVSLSVRDDGRGISWSPSGETAEGFGLRSMRERAAALGGCLTVRQRRSGGTELEVLLP
jgi:signal transduction histidine kinase